MTMNMKKTFPILMLLIILAGGCGVKAPPTPPDVLVSKAIKDLQGTVREETVYLNWSVPEANMNGSKPADLVRFRVLRREEQRGCLECPGEFKVRAELDLRSPKGYLLKDRSVTWGDKDLREGIIYIYRVIGINHWGYAGAPSNEAIIRWGTPPPPPLSLKGEEKDGSVLLTWEPTAGTNAYNIYRRHEGSPYSLDPVNKKPVQENQYADVNLKKGLTYFYVVRGVRFFGETQVEGVNSAEIRFTSR